MPTLNFVDYKKKKDRNETEHEERSNKSEKIFLYPSDRFFSQFTNFFFGSRLRENTVIFKAFVSFVGISLFGQRSRVIHPKVMYSYKYYIYTILCVL